MTARGLTVALICLPLAAAGCGGTDQDTPNTTEKGAYQAQVAGALGPLIIETGRISVEAPKISEARDFAERAAILERAYADSADVLATIVPPDEIGDLHHELVIAGQHLAEDTSAARVDLANGGGLTAFRQAAERYDSQLKVLDDEFAAKGYDVLAGSPRTP